MPAPIVTDLLNLVNGLVTVQQTQSALIATLADVVNHLVMAVANSIQPADLQPVMDGLTSLTASLTANNDAMQAVIASVPTP